MPSTIDIYKKHADLYRSYIELLKELGPVKANQFSKKELFRMAADRPAPSFYMQADAAQRAIRSILSNPNERRKIERDINGEREEAERL
jgi:hypothetical protein